MSVTQTVEIPVNHRLTIDVPPEVPAGSVILTFTPASAVKKRMSEEQEIELINRNAERLNREAMDVLSYQNLYLDSWLYEER
jgi:hypothetical protein